jgi:hypothetical protein
VKTHSCEVQPAATAAALALDAGIAVQDLPDDVLRARLLADGQVLELEDAQRLTSRTLPGVVIDDRQAKLTGPWTSSSAKRPFVDAGYQHDGHTGKGEKSARFEATLPPGRHEVRLCYSAQANRATNVPVVIHHRGGRAQTTVNQRQEPPLGGLAVSLGVFEFTESAVVEISNAGTDGYVIIDAVQFLPVE